MRSLKMALRPALHTALWMLCVLPPGSALPNYAQAPSAAVPDVASPTVNVLEHGVTKNAGAVVGGLIEDLMQKYPGGVLYFPPGDYLLGNETPRQEGLRIGSGFHGSIQFASGARFVCNTSTVAAGTCVHLVGASHVSSANMTIAYLHQNSLPMRRAEATGYTLLIDSSTSIRLSATTIEASPGACFWASDSADIAVDGIHVNNCTADGMHFENDRDVKLQNMWSSHTLDDGLAFTNLAARNPNCGSVATGIHVEDSASRGIAVPGGCDITVSDFSVNRTGVSGVLVNTDDAFHMRRPAKVSFSKGVISQAGLLASSSGTGNKFGVEVSAADHVSFDNVQILSPAGRGFDVSHGSTFVTLTNSTITAAGSNGIQIMNSSQIGLAGNLIEGSADYGTYLSGVNGFTGTDLTYKNVSNRRSRTNLHRAFWVERPAGPVQLKELKIIDDQPEATGYVVGCYDVFPHPLSVTGLSASIKQRSLQVECSADVSGR